MKQRGEALREIISQVRNGTYDYQSRECANTDWTKYDEAPIHEMADYLNNVRDIVDEANRRISERMPIQKPRAGRPCINAADIAKVLLVQEYTNSPNRVAEGLLLLFREKLGISKHFSYKTIERGYDRKSVNAILTEVEIITNEMVKGKEKDFSFDGTGCSSSNKDNYASIRQQQNKANSTNKTGDPDDTFPSPKINHDEFTYSVMGIGVNYKLISGMKVNVGNSIGETSMFPDTFAQTISMHPDMENVLGDGIYGALVQGLGAKEIRFLSNQVVWYWHRYAQKNTEIWLQMYHKRSISETVNSMIECRFGKRVMKKLKARKKTETYLKGVAHNIRRVGYLEIIDGLPPVWPKGRSR